MNSLTFDHPQDQGGTTSVASPATRTKRYNLVLPEDLFKEVERLANNEGTTVVEILRRFIKLGLLANRIQETPDAALIIREGTTEREIVIL